MSATNALGLVESLGRFLSAGQMAALCGAFLPQRVYRGSQIQSKDVAAMLKAIHAQEDREAAEEKVVAVVKKLKRNETEQSG